MRMRLKSVYSRFVSLYRNWLFSHFDAIYLCRWFVLLSGASSMFPQLFTIWIDIIIPLYAHVGQCWNNDTQHWFSIRRSLMICVLTVFRFLLFYLFLVSGRPQKRRKKNEERISSIYSVALAQWPVDFSPFPFNWRTTLLLLLLLFVFYSLRSHRVFVIACGKCDANER